MFFIGFFILLLFFPVGGGGGCVCGVGAFGGLGSLVGERPRGAGVERPMDDSRAGPGGGPPAAGAGCACSSRTPSGRVLHRPAGAGK